MLDVWKSVTRETLSVYVRVMSVAIGISMFVFGWDHVMNPAATPLQSSVFDVAREMAPLQTWGALFWLAGFMFVVAAVSGRFLIYAFAIMLAIALQVGWFYAVMHARVFLGASLSSAGIGLWLLAISLTVGTAFVPAPLRQTNATVRLVDDDDNTVVELHRRAG